MDDPALDGSSLSCYTANTGNVDVHYSSGIGNHFFYLLAEGLGRQDHRWPGAQLPDLQRVVGRRHRPGRGPSRSGSVPLTTYFTSGTTYAQARTGTLNAAKDLYGQGSTQYAAVAAAWSAVDVG